MPVSDNTKEFRARIKKALRWRGLNVFIWIFLVSLYLSLSAQNAYTREKMGQWALPLSLILFAATFFIRKRQNKLLEKCFSDIERINAENRPSHKVADFD